LVDGEQRRGGRGRERHRDPHDDAGQALIIERGRESPRETTMLDEMNHGHLKGELIQGRKKVQTQRIIEVGSSATSG